MWSEYICIHKHINMCIRIYDIWYIYIHVSLLMSVKKKNTSYPPPPTLPPIPWSHRGLRHGVKTCGPTSAIHRLGRRSTAVHMAQLFVLDRGGVGCSRVGGVTWEPLKISLGKNWGTFREGEAPRVSPEESYYFNDGQTDWMKVWVVWKMMTFPTLTGCWWNQPISKICCSNSDIFPSFWSENWKLKPAPS